MQNQKIFKKALSNNKKKGWIIFISFLLLTITAYLTWEHPQLLNTLKTGLLPIFAEKRAPESLMKPMRERGCVFDGLLNNEYGASLEIKTEMLKRTECKFLHRAIETWIKPPDFNLIENKINYIKNNTGKDFIYGLFVAESINITNGYYYPNEKRYFNFNAMCAPGSYGAYGKGRCKPSFEKEEYRKYVEYISQKAIDLGIQEITFGQTYYQDPNWKTDPKALDVVRNIRRYATSKNRPIAIGAQTNDIDDEKYLRTFDFITGGVGQHPDGYIEEGDPCWSYYFEKNGYCWAMMWHEKYKDKANNVFVYLDWNVNFYDDMNRFVRMNREERDKFLGKAYDFFNWRGVNFLMPLGAVLDGSGRGCYGNSREFYSANKVFSCKDEEAINEILKGRGSLPDYSKFISQEVPDKMFAGEKYEVSITMKNTSFRKWSKEDGYSLKMESPENIFSWNNNLQEIADSEKVEYGEEVVFKFNVGAPLEPGVYNFQWRMFNEERGWFGESSKNIKIEVIEK